MKKLKSQLKNLNKILKADLKLQKNFEKPTDLPEQKIKKAHWKTWNYPTDELKQSAD